jgi:hypothetical protein
MPATPWKTLRAAEADREYVVFATYLPARRIVKLPQFFWAVWKINQQIKRADGAVGYSLLAKPFRSDYWTLSVWESDAAAGEFAKAQPHGGIADRISSFVPSGFEVTRWTERGNSIPPKWDRALTRLKQATAPPA